MTEPKNLIFWGAGATAELGMRITKSQAQLVRYLCGTKDGDQPLQKRIQLAFGYATRSNHLSAFEDLITILGDSDDAYDSIHHIHHNQINIMARNCEADGDEELRKRIIHLRLIYDWPALKSVVRICPASETEDFRINDLFNLLDMHIPVGFGFPAPAAKQHNRSDPQQQFFDVRRLVGAKNALYLILNTMFYIDYAECLQTKKHILDQYFEISNQIARRMQREGVKLATENRRLDEPEF